MKRAKNFFLKLDIVRNYCRVLLALSLLLLFFSRLFSIAFFLMLFLSILFAVGAVLRVPAPSAIAGYVSDVNAEFEARFRRGHSTLGEEDWTVLYANSPRHAGRARNIGNRMYFPEFYTLFFYRAKGTLHLRMKQTNLYDSVEPKSIETSWQGERITVLQSEPVKSSEEYIAVTVRGGEELLLECYVRNDHSWQSLLRFDRERIQISDKQS